MLKKILFRLLPALPTASRAFKPEFVIRYRDAGSDAFRDRGLLSTRAGAPRFEFSSALVELSPASNRSCADD